MKNNVSPSAPNKIISLHHPESKIPRAIESNSEGDYNPDLKIRWVYPPKKTSEIINKPETTKLYIKNMVSLRCIIAVKSVLENMELKYARVELGEAEIFGIVSAANLARFKSGLLPFGFELLEDKKSILVEKIKLAIIEIIHYSDELPMINFSDYLSEKLNLSYTYLSNLFAEVKGTSIQHFIMLHKIERVKELLMYDELTLSEIAWKLHYSSDAHLSNQFRHVIGFTPSHAKATKNLKRIPLDCI